ncbi:MAG: hypothetical protein U0793_32515 [Gemmataceae bacterium]
MPTAKQQRFLLASLLGCVLTCFAVPSVRAGEAEPVAKRLLPEDIYSTSPQKDLKRLCFDDLEESDRIAYKKTYGRHLERILKDLQMGSSQAILVNGWNLTEAVGRSGRPFIGVPLISDEGRGRDRWLVVYLGFGSATEPTWRVHSVDVRKEGIRFSYSRTGVAAGSRPYFFWIPLERRDAASIALELFDEGLKRVAFSRLGKEASAAEKADRIVPLHAVYATSHESGLRHLYRGVPISGKPERPYAKDLDALYHRKGRLFDVLLAEGDDVAAALKAGNTIFLDKAPADVAARHPANPAAKNLWLVADLAWDGGQRHVVTVEVIGSKIRFRYAEPKPMPGVPVAAIVVEHYYWAPLGSLAPGSYHLELYEDIRRAPILSRLVEVK